MSCTVPGIAALTLMTAVVAGSGCTYSGGAFLYALGVGRGQKVPAQFRLTTGPVLILIDDVSHRADSAPAVRYLFDDLSQELLRNKAAQKIIPDETLLHLKQSVPNFEKRGCRELGREAGAEQVLWIEIQDFSAEEQVQDVLVAASIVVTVKVVNTMEDANPARARLWPENPAGHTVAVTLTGSEVSLAKTQDAILKELTNRLAVDIAKLFYEHRLGDFERPK